MSNATMCEWLRSSLQALSRTHQQLLQKTWPQLMAVASEARTSLRHTMHDTLPLAAAQQQQHKRYALLSWSA